MSQVDEQGNIICVGDKENETEAEAVAKKRQNEEEQADKKKTRKKNLEEMRLIFNSYLARSKHEACCVFTYNDTFYSF